MKIIAIYITTLLLLTTTTYGQKTLQYADSIRNTFHIPELSYAVVSGKNTLEIAAIGRH